MPRITKLVGQRFQDERSKVYIEHKCLSQTSPKRLNRLLLNLVEIYPWVVSCVLQTWKKRSNITRQGSDF